MCEDPGRYGNRRSLIEPPSSPWLKDGPKPDPNRSACCGKEIIERDGKTVCGGCGRETQRGPVKKY